METKQIKLGLKSNVLKENIMLIILIVGCVVSAICIPTFRTFDNFINILMQISINSLLATGMTFVILTGGIDLSVASMVAIGGVVSSSIVLNVFPEASILVCLLVGIGSALVLGLVVGSITGVCVAKLHVPPFIVTLAMTNIVSGVAFLYTNSTPVFGMPSTFKWLGLDRIANTVPHLVILMVIVIAIAWVVLSRTRFGRYVYAVGSNEEVSKLSGINVVRTKIIVYIICACLAALAGFAFASQIQSGSPSSGKGYELNAIAAVVMGGTSMNGGRGGMLQTVMGVCVIGVLNNVLGLLSVSSYLQTIIIGVVILLAVILDQHNAD